MKLDILFHYEVDEQTGEIIYIGKEEIKVDTKSVSKTVSKSDNGLPELILEDTKFKLTNAALELMNVEAGCKVDIKYEKDGTPVIGSDEVWGTKGGNKISKTNTVICKGIKHDELAKYGTKFTLEKHSSKEGLFILKGNKQPEKLQGDENISSDIDLSDLLEDGDVTEIDSNFFKL